MCTKRTLAILGSTLLISVAASFATGNFKIITYNVLYGFNHGKSVDKGVEWIAEQNPDVVAFQELRGFSQEKLRKKAQRWGHNYVHYFKRPKGMPLAITSKTPLSNIQEIGGQGIRRDFMVAETADLHFMVLHMTSQRLFHRKRESKLMCKKLGAMLSAGKDVVALGDFNALSPLDRPYLKNLPTFQKRMKETPKKRANLNNGRLDYSIIQRYLDLGLVDVCHEVLPNSPVLKGSFPSTLLEKIPNRQKQREVLRRIDFVFMSPALSKKVVGADIPREGLLNEISDHYPVIVELEL